MALVLFALGAYGASLVRDDYREGKMQLVFQRYMPINPTFDREADAAFFWGVTVVNIGVIAFLFGGGIILVVASLLGAR